MRIVTLRRFRESGAVYYQAFALTPHPSDRIGPIFEGSTSERAVIQVLMDLKIIRKKHICPAEYEIINRFGGQ